MPPKKFVIKTGTAIMKEKIKKCNATITDTSFDDRVTMKSWVLNDKLDFPKFIDDFAEEVDNPVKRKPIIKWNDEGKFEINPFSQQKLVSDYMSDQSPYRGLLLYHGLGSGKSGASIMIAEGFKGREVVILLPKSIRKNYEDEIKTFGDIAYRSNSYWCFIPIKLNLDDSKNDEVYTIFESKGIKRLLLKDIIDNSSETYKGLWMIDYTKETPNYGILSSDKQAEIDKQIELMYNTKYTFIHYNMGASLLTHIIKTFNSNYINIKLSALKSNYPDSVINSKNNKKYRYKLLEYMYNPDNNIKNPFSDKVVIIDEVHNLVSMMAGGGINGPILYEMLMRADNCKIIALSGTPVINYAYELGLLFNMLRGYTKAFTLTLSKMDGKWDNDELNTILERTLLINRKNLDSKTNTIEITRNPYGFISTLETTPGGKIINKGVKLDSLNNISDQEFLEIISTKLLENNYTCEGEISFNHFNIFPDMLNTNSSNHSYFNLSSNLRNLSEDSFNKQYIDYNEMGVLKSSKILFKKKIVGLVSFFNEISGTDERTGSNLFPDIKHTPTEDTDVIMSDYQFSLYCKARDIERELEELSKKKGAFNQGGDGQSVGSTPNLFRVLSRQSGIFVFPPHIERPRPADFKIKPANAELNDMEITGEELKELLRQLCNTDRNPELNITINEFIEKVTSNTKHANYLNEEIFSKVTFPPDKESLHDKIDYICKSHKELFDDFDEDFSDETMTYLGAINTSIAKLEEEHLKGHPEIGEEEREGEGIGDTMLSRYSLEVLSPKYHKILMNIDKTPGLVFCYSQFRNAEGVGLLLKVLSINGYSELKINERDLSIIKNTDLLVGTKVRYTLGKNVWKTSTINEIIVDKYLLNGETNEFTKDELYKCYYSLWTGSESVEQRGKVLELYNNNDNNSYGQQCLILLTTSSGSEGISLMNVRQVHILEPYWNNVRIKQVIGRARRIKSHINLPKDQQNVSVYNYVIKFSREQQNGKWGANLNIEELKKIDKDDLPENISNIINKEDISTSELVKLFAGERIIMSQIIMDKDSGKTSDEALAEIAVKKSSILNEFLTLMQEAAVDCKFNRLENIKSNNSLADLNCFDVIPGGDDADNNYNYNLTNTLEYEKGISAEESLETITEKIKIMKLRLSGNKYLHYIAFLPNNIENIEEYLETENKTLDIFNYYTYYNLDYTTHLKLYNKTKIGTIFIKGTEVSSEFNEHFIKKIKYYLSIEQVVTKQGTLLPPKSEVDKIDWSSTIKVLHKEFLEKTKWECVVCDNATYLGNITICPECNIGTPDMYQTIKSQKSLLEIQPTAQTTKPKVKVSKFGKRK
uniref:Helicase C-terminal domain-containing protein n=1 Tax=viral metagenome TaxID=1070528 RepID=A0A6C0EIU3_9ZZZZ